MKDDSEEIIQCLESNGIDSYKLFKSLNLSNSDLKPIGLTIGIFACLCNNMHCYANFLQNRQH